MKFTLSILLACLYLLSACGKPEEPSSTDIEGYDLLSHINGHWVGTNQTSFGFYEWFAFDFRPISASHSHSIYEGGTNQNIINSVFVGDLNGEQKIYARNGGWLGSQYRATYFVLDRATESDDESYYRLVDAVGGADRAYIEFRFRQDSIFFDAYKDDSGSLDQPLLHMEFKGSNRNPTYSESAIQHFDYPQSVNEVEFGNAFDDLIDPDSALFLEEDDDPFPKSDHGYLSDVSIEIIRDAQSDNKRLLLYLSKEELISEAGIANYQNIDNSVIRTIDIQSTEDVYRATYLHPDTYYCTVFLDNDENGFPSEGDYSSVSLNKIIQPEMLETMAIEMSVTVQ